MYVSMHTNIRKKGKKAMNTKTQIKMSDNTKKWLIIGAIILLAAIILTTVLTLILQADPKTPDANATPDSNTSSLPIKNGDFAVVSSEDTSYPKSALNWTKYGYKAVSGSTHDFQSIGTNEKVVMGIVNTNEDEWATVISDLEPEGISVTNPGVHADIEADDGNVYMIATKQATSASILSDSTSISASTSVKITIRINTAQLAEGSNAVIMIQKSTVSAKSENWYAYNFEVGKADGWQSFEFYIFNREASTKYIRVSVGLGNVYGGADESEEITGEGALFIDDIAYETVNADVYRQYADETEEGDTTYKIIENEDITADTEYRNLVAEGSEIANTFETSKQYVDFAGVSPFTNRDDFMSDDGEPSGFKIYQMSHNGSATSNAIALRLSDSITLLASDTDKDHHHFSFWVRVSQVNKVAKANVYVQKRVNGEWEDLSSGSFTAIATNQDITDDANCGWVKYDIYLKPSAVETEISILFVLGNKDGYTEDEIAKGLLPNGDLYVTSPAYELISYKDYNNASSGSYVKKLNLVGSSASTTVTNGSFSDLNNTGVKPSNWTPAFAGDNSIYKDGKGDAEIAGLNRLASDVEGSGTIKNFEFAPTDDDQHNVLQIVNNTATSFGYISSDINLSAKTVYVFSVLAKTDGDLNPYFYLIDNSKDRDEAVVASVTRKYAAGTTINEQLFGQVSEDDLNPNNAGWVRYYIVYVTGAESKTVRLALFNGSIQGNELVQGTVYYDNVDMKTLGTYSLVKDEENEDADHYVVKWNESSNYDKTFEQLLEDGDLEALEVVQPTDEEWEEMKLIPEEKEEPAPTDPKPTPNKVDWGLLLSVISSIALVAALLVVIVVKIFKKRSAKRNA